MATLISFILSNFTFTLLLTWMLVCLFIIIFNKKSKKPLSEKILAYFLFFNLGISGIYGFVMHVFYGEFIARFIGWTQSPFQAEVGFANLAFGITGILAFFGNFGFRLATLIGFACFLWGAAAGHVYQMIAHHNFAPGNAGFIFWTDIFMPALGFLLLFINYIYTKR